MDMTDTECDRSRELTTEQERTRSYMNAYNRSRKNDEYYTVMKRLNNKLSYLRKHHNLTDDNEEFKVWRLLYPELVNIKSTLENINLIMSNNASYSHIKDKLHAIIDSVIS